MNLIGRYERLRSMDVGTGALGPPLLYDRKELDTKRDPLRPYPWSEEWWKSPSGAWIETRRLLRDQRGVLSNGNALAFGNGSMGQYDENFSAATIPLSTAYTANSAGRALGAQFAIPEADTLNTVYFYVDSFTGLKALVTTLNLEIRSDSSNAPVVASAALATATMDPSGFNSGWTQFTGLTHAWSAATYYWPIVADADGGAVNFVNIRLHGGQLEDNSRGFNFPVGASNNTSNGWTTKTVNGGAMYFVLVFASGMSLGYPVGTTVTVPSSTLQRGQKNTGLTAALKIWGYSGGLGVSGSTTGNIYLGTDGPNSGAAATGSLPTRGGIGTNYCGVMLSAPYTIPAATQHRLVIKGSSNSTIFRGFKVGTVNAGSAAELMAAFPGAGGITYTEEKAGSPNDWGNDDTNAYCPCSLYIYDQVAAASSTIFVQSGGGGMAGSYYA